LFIKWEDDADGKYRKDNLQIGFIQGIASTAIFSLENERGIGSIDIFPNPANAFCKVIAKEDLKGEITISLWSAEGKSIQHWIFSKGLIKDESMDIPLSNLPQGNYLLKFDGKNIQGVKKLQIIR
jgi:hypothetical protein